MERREWRGPKQNQVASSPSTIAPIPCFIAAERAPEQLYMLCASEATASSVVCPFML